MSNATKMKVFQFSEWRYYQTSWLFLSDWKIHQTLFTFKIKIRRVYQTSSDFQLNYWYFVKTLVSIRLIGISSHFYISSHLIPENFGFYQTYWDFISLLHFISLDSRKLCLLSDLLGFHLTFTFHLTWFQKTLASIRLFGISSHFYISSHLIPEFLYVEGVGCGSPNNVVRAA